MEKRRELIGEGIGHKTEELDYGISPVDSLKGTPEEDVLTEEVPIAEQPEGTFGAMPISGEEPVDIRIDREGEIPTEEVPTELEPDFDPDAIPAPTIEAAPEYEKTPQQEAWEEMYGGELTDLIKEGGKGIPEATQRLMKKQIYDDLKGREQESLRNLRDNMEQRGITNSGLLFSEESKVRSTTTRAMAASITEIGIKSAFMKMASFENALGMAGNFLGYLSEQSQLAYAPKFATWQANQQKKLMQFQANVEIYKMKLHQAYTTKNMYLQKQLQSELNAEMHAYNKEMAEMEIEAANKTAEAKTGGDIIGIILGGIFRLLLPF